MKPAVTAVSLRDLLRQRGLSMAAVAILAGTDTATVSRACSGKRKLRPESVVKLSQALGISAKRLEAMQRAAWTAAQEDQDAAVSA